MKKFNLTEQEILELGIILKKKNGDPRRVKIVPVEDLGVEKLEVFINYYYDKSQEDGIRRNGKGRKESLIFRLWATDRTGEETSKETILERTIHFAKLLDNKKYSIKDDKIIEVFKETPDKKSKSFKK